MTAADVAELAVWLLGFMTGYVVATTKKRHTDEQNQNYDV